MQWRRRAVTSIDAERDIRYYVRPGMAPFDRGNLVLTPKV